MWTFWSSTQRDPITKQNLGCFHLSVWAGALVINIATRANKLSSPATAANSSVTRANPPRRHNSCWKQPLVPTPGRSSHYHNNRCQPRGSYKPAKRCQLWPSDTLWNNISGGLWWEGKQGYTAITAREKIKHANPWEQNALSGNIDVGTGSLRSFSEKSSLIKWVVWLTINLSWEREEERGLVKWERRQRYTLGLWNNPQSSGTNRYSAAGISSYLRVLSLDHSTHPQTIIHC